MATRLLGILLSLFLLAACGQKGPLRLPDEPADHVATNQQEKAR
ncbi:lipoprotein [Litorivivens sp.]